jgi:hypothetical protein
MAPYHVIQATVQGQLRLFEKAGLETVEYRVSEVTWPAPAKLTARVLHEPRSLILYSLRRVSQAVSAVAPQRLGNRYFSSGVPGQH